MNGNRLTENQSSVATLRNAAKAREIVAAQRAAQFQRVSANANISNKR